MGNTIVYRGVYRASSNPIPILEGFL